MIELTSTAPGGGKTHLLYLFTALAILPSRVGGSEACVVIIDTDGAFSVPRLAQQVRDLFKKHSDVIVDVDAGADLLIALKHVHIFSPQSLASTTATLDSLPTYLFDKSRHYSFDRPVGFIALDSAAAFYWQAKAEEEDAALLSATTTSGAHKPQSKPAPYAQLTTSIKSASVALCCPVIFTAWHLGPVPPTAHHHGPGSNSLRPSVPSPLSQVPTVRLIVQRVPVRKFPAGISIAEAQREAEDRQKAVEEGKFECVVNEWDVDERTLQRLQAVGAGFGFSIREEGVIMEEGE